MRLRAALLLAIFSVSAFAQNTGLSLSRPVRPWEFLSAVGTRAAMFGNEAGTFEGWVYPLKILRDFHLVFHIEGRALPAESLARTVSVQPEACSILYAGDTFQVRETFFVPVHEPGAVIVIEVETAHPLEVEAVFQRDFQLEWPAALGGTYINWDPNFRAFKLGEEQKKFAALVGSPTAALSGEEYSTNYASSSQNSFLLGPTAKGKDTKVVVIAGSLNGPQEVEDSYRRLASTYPELRRTSSDHYRHYLNETVSVTLPDAQLQQAYDWSRVSMIQGMVNNPYLGTGLIAGYRTSGDGTRPGFAWFFGRDALWTSFALNAEGDFADTRTALDFLSHYQRADGRVPHEISQSATFVPWFTDYPYPYASVDATPLYIVAIDDYVRKSGDINFAREKWDSLWKAYEFLKSTYDAQGLPRNFGLGHGWIEGGPLLPVETELYQSALGAEALHALSNLAHLTGKEDLSNKLADEFAHQKQLVEHSFWSPEKNLYAYALDQNSQRLDTASVLSTVPLWFGLLDEDRAQLMIEQLADADHQTDWGMRIISSQNPLYDPGGYHYGSVWPLFTGWATGGEYRYHRAQPAYANLRSNSLLALDGALGHVTEVLSGDYYQPLSTSSPHQIWSAAMVVSPLLRGLLGMDIDATSHQLRFGPHVPAEWESFEVHKIHVAGVTLDLNYRRTKYGITLELRRTGAGDCALEFSPALSPRAEVAGAEIDGRAVSVRMERNRGDQHVTLRFPIHSGTSTLHIRLGNDFGYDIPSKLPPLGERSQELKILSESWGPSNENLAVNVSGVPGKQYDLMLWNSGQIASVEGAKLVKEQNGETRIRVELPANDSLSYAHGKIIIRFAGKGSQPKSRKKGSDK
ncbi:MAG TPA: amylo-alpha-1,6-glucosidase [Terriglobales bacterium]|nr:amylo-alpha-1,6-glucosidase [Terriglobales bacterium]